MVLAIYIQVLKRKCQEFIVIGRMYLLTHLFFITRDYLASLLLIPYCNSCRTVFSSSVDNCCPVSALLNLIPFLVVKLGMPNPDQFESWHDDLPTPRSLDNEVSRQFNMRFRQFDRADLLDTLIKYLVSADPDSFPNIIISGIRMYFACHISGSRAQFLCLEANQKPFGEREGWLTQCFLPSH